MTYQVAVAYLLYLLVPAVLVGCAAGPETHKEGYYIVMNDNTNKRMCCTPEGFTAAKKAIDRRDETAARTILFHTNPEWRNIGWRTMNGTKYYIYSGHLYKGSTDSAMAKKWEEFNQAFGYKPVPWLAETIKEQEAEAERYWKDSEPALNSSTNAPATTGNARNQGGIGQGDPCGGSCGKK